ncbi:hypothetical protein N0V82_002192 [Gnomoniopsis sp. IMI 355080]|nr:hypothetical protein N0V82_002192 [Gnomoniopsis sp. IMI 355080]
MAGSWGNKNVFATFWHNASYKSFGKNHFQESDAEEPTGLPLNNYPTRASSEEPPSVLRPDKRVPSTKLTLHQFLYIFGSHGIGAMIISGGINFAIAYAMYTTTDDPVRLFELPNTLVGDAAVTVIMQTIMTWLIEMLVVNRDLRKGNIQPIGFITEPGADNPSPSRLTRAVRWFLLLDLSKKLRKRRQSIKRKLLYLFAQVVRAFAVSVVCFAIVFGPTVGILIALGVKDGGDWDYASRWLPEGFKGVLGGVLALMTTPFFAMFWMTKCGWNGGIHEAVMINGNENK